MLSSKATYSALRVYVLFVYSVQNQTHDLTVASAKLSIQLQEHNVNVKFNLKLFDAT